MLHLVADGDLEDISPVTDDRWTGHLVVDEKTCPLEKTIWAASGVGDLQVVSNDTSRVGPGRIHIGISIEATRPTLAITRAMSARLLLDKRRNSIHTLRTKRRGTGEGRKSQEGTSNGEELHDETMSKRC